MNKLKKPLWAYIYPDLYDKDKLIAIYKQHKSHKRAAKAVGCCERTFRRACLYHGIKKPFMKVPPKISEIFHAVNNNDNITENKSHDGKKWEKKL